MAKQKKRYEVVWDNGHAVGTLGWFATKSDALFVAREWKREMVAIDDDPREAREVYQWEIIDHAE